MLNQPFHGQLGELLCEKTRPTFGEYGLLYNVFCFCEKRRCFEIKTFRTFQKCRRVYS